MFDIKNLKTRRLVIIGVVSSIVLIVSIIAVYFIFIKDTPVKRVTTAKTVTPVRTGTPVGKPEEVYLQSFKEGMTLDYAGQFERVKKLIFPGQNITLATIQQINEAFDKGLKACNAALGLDNNGKEKMIAARPGPPNIIGLSSVCTQARAVDIVPDIGNIKNIWVYGVKPSKGTKDVFPFSPSKWSQFDP